MLKAKNTYDAKVFFRDYNGHRRKAGVAKRRKQAGGRWARRRLRETYRSWVRRVGIDV